ncbi:hypothetical protein ONE63_008934 [Megalurothrips usitatus]|uniref:Uncharacterized protein n=1 Tax=Megalurothrips usitatus TaxID=439358 RepID=A0AAV7XPY9_9NEOP|nr:hypothetical protein ONE63_008934 [Megalurothrips usitatus]
MSSCDPVLDPDVVRERGAAAVPGHAAAHVAGEPVDAARQVAGLPAAGGAARGRGRRLRGLHRLPGPPPHALRLPAGAAAQGRVLGPHLHPPVRGHARQRRALRRGAHRRHPVLPGQPPAVAAHQGGGEGHVVRHPARLPAAAGHAHVGRRLLPALVPRAAAARRHVRPRAPARLLRAHRLAPLHVQRRRRRRGEHPHDVDARAGDRPPHLLRLPQPPDPHQRPGGLRPPARGDEHRLLDMPGRLRRGVRLRARPRPLPVRGGANVQRPGPGLRLL